MGLADARLIVDTPPLTLALVTPTSHFSRLSHTLPPTAHPSRRTQVARVEMIAAAAAKGGGR